MIDMQLQLFGGRGASSGKTKNTTGGGNIATLESQYNKLLEKQASLGRTMYLGTDSENAKARKQWNSNNEKLRKMKKDIETAKAKSRETQRKAETKKPFVNSFGEATKRPITNATYEKAQKKLSKQIMKYIGG